MARRSVWILVLLGLAAGFFAGLFLRETPGSVGDSSAFVARPNAPAGARNVLLLTADALRWDHLSGFGYARRTSPNLDMLIESGVVFDTLVPSGCSTKVSLTSLFTSVDYSRHGLLEHEEALPEHLTTLAELFQAGGWETGGFVATPHLMAEMGYARGFDRYHDFADIEADYVSADIVVSEMVSALRARGEGVERPFFYYVHLEEPHPPWRHGSPWGAEGEAASGRREKLLMEQPFNEGCTYVPSAEDLAAFGALERQRMIDAYDGSIHYADAWIGVLLATLRDLSEYENTIIAVATDHGLELVERYSATHGMNGFDEVVRNFLIVSDAGGAIEAGGATARQGRIFDIGPTLLALSGLEVPSGLGGVDLLGDVPPPPFAFTLCYSGFSVRGEGFKLIRPEYTNWRWKNRNRPVGLGEDVLLFDLAADPGEHHDIAAERPEQVERMLAALARYQAERAGEQRREAGAEQAVGPAAQERLRALGYIE